MGKHEKKNEDVSMADASIASAADVSKKSKKDKKDKKDKSKDKSKDADTTAGDATFAIDTEGDEKLAEPENLSPIARECLHPKRLTVPG